MPGKRIVLGMALLVLPLACAASPFRPTDPHNLVVTGTIRFVELEGGFWTIRGDDNVTYEPLTPLAADFQHDGLRVRVEGKIRTDKVSVRMAGPILEIVQIRKL
jgi:hypothetical protein